MFVLFIYNTLVNGLFWDLYGSSARSAKILIKPFYQELLSEMPTCSISVMAFFYFFTGEFLDWNHSVEWLLNSDVIDYGCALGQCSVSFTDWLKFSDEWTKKNLLPPPKIVINERIFQTLDFSGLFFFIQNIKW